MSKVTKPVFLNETGERMADAIDIIANGFQKKHSDIASLNEVVIASTNVFETIGVPVFVSNVADYAAYGITETGWYIFCRATAHEGTVVTDATRIEGAAGWIAELGADHIDLAIRFDVAAESQKVVIEWDSYVDTFIFKATDLAIRNLDYRTTFYVYDIAPYATWEYALTTDTTFVADKAYYVKDGDEYTLAEVTAGEAVPAYYVQTGEETYERATGTFMDGVTYYTYDGTTYTAAEVTTGAAIPAYYNHSKVTFSGMVRNITYKCDTVIDCPQVYVLPEIEDDIHGCWFEIRLRHSGSFSSTLEVPDGVEVATEHTQAETAGLNMVDLHYSNVGGLKIWRFLNTHSSIPTPTPTPTPA